MLCHLPEESQALGKWGADIEASGEGVGSCPKSHQPEPQDRTLSPQKPHNP